MNYILAIFILVVGVIIIAILAREYWILPAAIIGLFRGGGDTSEETDTSAAIGDTGPSEPVEDLDNIEPSEDLDNIETVEDLDNIEPTIPLESQEIADKTGSAERSDICENVNDLLNSFLTDRFTPELAMDMENMISDIVVDTDSLTLPKINKMKQTSLDTATAKILLDTMIHFYIYNEEPNTISAGVLRQNIKTLKLITKSCFASSSVAQLLKIANSIIKPGGEKKAIHKSPLDCFRREKVLTITGKQDTKYADELTNLREEVTAKNMEIRRQRDELSRQASRINTRPLGTDLFLAECNRERRLLQEQVYELKRNISTMRNSDTGAADAIRRQIEELRNRNAKLERAVTDATRTQSGEGDKIRKLDNDLKDCQQLLDEVLRAHEQ